MYVVHAAPSVTRLDEECPTSTANFHRLALWSVARQWYNFGACAFICEAALPGPHDLLVAHLGDVVRSVAKQRVAVTIQITIRQPIQVLQHDARKSNRQKYPQKREA